MSFQPSQRVVQRQCGATRAGSEYLVFHREKDSFASYVEESCTQKAGTLTCRNSVGPRWCPVVTGGTPSPAPGHLRSPSLGLFQGTQGHFRSALPLILPFFSFFFFFKFIMFDLSFFSRCRGPRCDKVVVRASFLSPPGFSFSLGRDYEGDYGGGQR